MDKIKSFKDLRIWQKGIELVEKVYRVSQSFPKEEVYGLSSQVRRAAVSVPANIAEGFKRFHVKEYRHFLFIALGSLAELETELIIADKLGYMKSSELNDFMEDVDHISRMISALLNKIH